MTFWLSIASLMLVPSTTPRAPNAAPATAIAGTRALRSFPPSPPASPPTLRKTPLALSSAETRIRTSLAMRHLRVIHQQAAHQVILRRWRRFFFAESSKDAHDQPSGFGQDRA